MLFLFRALHRYRLRLGRIVCNKTNGLTEASHIFISLSANKYIFMLHIQHIIIYLHHARHLLLKIFKYNVVYATSFLILNVELFKILLRLIEDKLIIKYL